MNQRFYASQDNRTTYRRDKYFSFLEVECNEGSAVKLRQSTALPVILITLETMCNNRHIRDERKKRVWSLNISSKCLIARTLKGFGFLF